MANDIALGVRVLIGIPTTSQAVRSIGWTDAKSNLQMPLGSSAGVRWTLDEPVDEARNNLCKTALDENVDYLFMLGDDVIPPPNTLITLLDKIGRYYPTRNHSNQRASMISGIYWTKTYPPEPYIWRLGDNGRLLDGSYRNWIAGEFFDIDIAGCDCLLIETAMLREIPFPWFSLDWVWEEGQKPSSINTEDYYFYTKAREHGFRLFADTSIECYHEDRQTKAWFGLHLDMHQAGGVPEVGDDEILIADLGAGVATNNSLFGDKAKIVRFDARESVKPDVRCDIRQIPDNFWGKFDWVNASHVIEHFPRRLAYDVFKHWLKLLKPGGTITVHVPNFEAAANIILHPEGVEPSLQHYAWQMVYGDQHESGAAWEHLNGFTPRKLENLFKSVGVLGNIVIEQEQEGLNLKASAKLVGSLDPYALTTAWKRIKEKESVSISDSAPNDQPSEAAQSTNGRQRQEVPEVVNTL